MTIEQEKQIKDYEKQAKKLCEQMKNLQIELIESEPYKGYSMEPLNDYYENFDYNPYVI